MLQEVVEAFALCPTWTLVSRAQLLLEIVQKTLRSACELEEHYVESIDLDEPVNQPTILHLSCVIVLEKLHFK
jgi:hypothetical protein